MRIVNWIKESYQDFPGKSASIVFTPGCQYKCPACHAKPIYNSEERISNEDVLNYLDSRKNWIDGVVLCGGEPTLEIGLESFVRKLKGKGLAVKLDTNGKNFGKLQDLRDGNLIDYVAMDVKGPLEFYPEITGKPYVDERDDVMKGIAIVSGFPDYEFRTTVVPILRSEEEISFMTPAEIGEAAKMIVNYTGRDDHKYYLQKFKSAEKGIIFDDRLSKESLPKEMWETPKEILEEGLIEAKKHLPNARIR